MDIRPTGLPIPATSALDALHRVRSSAAADDSEDSQTAGYLFGDGGQGSSEHEEEGGEASEPERDVVEMSLAVLSEHAEHAEHAGHPESDAALIDEHVVKSPTIHSPKPASERHVDIEV